MGLAFIGSGALYFGISLAQKAPVIEYQQPTTRLAPTVSAVQPRPVRLASTRLGLDVAVIDGEYTAKNQSWKLDRQHAFYLAPGQAPLQTEAWPLVYGHARSEIFAPLAKAERGEVLSVTSEDGRVYTYVLSGSVSVEPEQGAVINTPPEGQGLQLLTCEGFNFEKRRILYFTLVGEESAQKGITI